MAAKDAIDIKILDDGRVVLTTDTISIGNHRNADELMRVLAELLGGAVTVEDQHGHSHAHHDQHDHLKQH